MPPIQSSWNLSSVRAMTETQLILHLRNVIQIAYLMLEKGQTELVMELLSDTLRETERPVLRERVVIPNVK